VKEGMRERKRARERERERGFSNGARKLNVTGETFRGRAKPSLRDAGRHDATRGDARRHDAARRGVHKRARTIGSGPTTLALDDDLDPRQVQLVVRETLGELAIRRVVAT